MSNSEAPQSIKKLQLTRRRFLRDTAALTVAAAVLPNSSIAQSHDAEGSRYSGDHPVASIAKNIVETDSGRVSGYESGGIITFKGIPYGATTDGASRFLAPAKPKPWPGVRGTLHWGWVSPQASTSNFTSNRGSFAHDDEAFMFQWDNGHASEDCLRINVWTPATDSKKRPVLFWIHGGGYTSGSSNELATYDGENLARRSDVVVVSINHRLGPLGFLNLSEFGSQYAHSSNAGILDIIAALEWVKTNIANFGGDSASVTIFGQSGGGGKVSTLMGMPAAKGLFHRAIIESSGNLFIRQLTMETSQRTTAAMLKELGIDKSAIAKIHTDSSEDLLDAAARVGRQGGVVPGGLPGFGSWGPVVDGHDLPRHVWDPIAPEFSATVPLMVGTVLNEMGNSVQMGDASLEDMNAEEMRKRLAALFPHTADALVTAISQAHTIRKPFDVLALANGLPRRVDALTAAGLKADQGLAPVFMYKFAWQSPILDGRARAYHCSELPFVFFNTERCATMTGGGPEPMALAEKVSDAWVNFARHGNPNHPGLPHWPAFSKDTKPTMVFDTQCEVKHNLDDAQVAAAKA